MRLVEVGELSTGKADSVHSFHAADQHFHVMQTHELKLQVNVQLTQLNAVLPSPTASWKKGQITQV